jgi:hypothetical protein
MRDSIKVLRETYSGKDDVQGIRRDPLTVERKLNSAGSRFERMAPDASLRTAIGHARVAVAGFVEKVNTFLEEDWREYRSAVEGANMKVFSEIESASIDG